MMGRDDLHGHPPLQCEWPLLQRFCSDASAHLLQCEGHALHVVGAALELGAGAPVAASHQYCLAVELTGAATASG